LSFTERGPAKRKNPFNYKKGLGTTQKRNELSDRQEDKADLARARGKEKSRRVLRQYDKESGA